MFNDNIENQIADPAGVHNSEMNNITASPEIMTSLQMFQQQRYGSFICFIIYLRLAKKIIKVFYSLILTIT